MFGDFKLHETHQVVDNDEYTCVLDEFRRLKGVNCPDDYDQMLVVHLDFKKFSKTTLSRMMSDWDKLRACISLPMFAWADVDDAKWERFVKLLGFQHVHTLPPEACTDGQARRVFVSFRTGNPNVAEEHATADHGKLPVVGADAVSH